MRNVPALGGRRLPAPVLRTWRRFPMRFGSWIASGPSHFDYHSLTSCIMRSPRILRAGVSHFSLRKKTSWKQAKGLLRRWHYVAAGVARIADRTTAYLKRRPLGAPLGGLCCLVDAADAEAAMTAFASRAGVKRVCLADQARGCEDDARDECS